MLEPGGGFYLEAFFELQSDRPPDAIRTLADGTKVPVSRPVPFTAINSYARRFGIHDTDDFSLFLRAIRAMEREVANLDEPQKPENQPP